MFMSPEHRDQHWQFWREGGSPSGVPHWNHSKVQGKLPVPYSMAAQSNLGTGVLVALSAQVGSQCGGGAWGVPDD